MAYGNFLVQSTQVKRVKDFFDALDEDPAGMLERCTLEPTPDNLFMVLVSADCSWEWTCTECEIDRCIGCGHQVIIDLDADTILCAECNTRDVWETIVFNMKDGKRKADRARLVDPLVNTMPPEGTIPAPAGGE